MSPIFDSNLTLSIPCKPLPPNPLHVHLLEHFDTLSVYRGPLCEPVARTKTARSAKPACNDSVINESHPDQQIKPINYQHNLLAYRAIILRCNTVTDVTSP